jgi:hypothetical protein
MASAVFSVTSVAIHPYENRCKEQKRKLIAILYRPSPIPLGVEELVELLELCGDENVAQFLWSQLKATTEDSSWEAMYLTHKLAILLKNQEALELSEQYEDSIRSMGSYKEQEAILRQFIKVIERSGPPRPGGDQ